jgi:hypothetical protein
MLTVLPVQAKKHDLARCEAHITTLQGSEASHKTAVACVLRHWCMLTEELKAAFLRLQKTTPDVEADKEMLEQIIALEDTVPAGMDEALGSSCKMASQVMQDVVKVGTFPRPATRTAPSRGQQSLVQIWPPDLEWSRILR